MGEQSASPVSRPWITTSKKVKESDFGLKVNPNPPSQVMTLEYVLGYRSFDCRNNVHFSPNGSIIYHQSSLGIIMTPYKNSFNQTFTHDHKDDISCLDVVGDLVASGEMGS